MGLIRYRDGAYQVAVPRDAGPVDFDRAVQRCGNGERPEPSLLRVVRRRYFEWLSLSPDPIIAVERLRQLLESHAELAKKLNALEKKYDTKFRVVFEAIRDLMTPEPSSQRKIGFRREQS